MDLQDMPVLKELSRRGYNIVLGSQLSAGESAYHDTELPAQSDRSVPVKRELPYRIRNMYRELTNRQLHEYFAWREQAREGNYQPTGAKAAYIYIYELLNNVGVDSPEDCIEKLIDFEQSFLEAGLLEAGLEAEAMERKLRRWMLEYSIVHDLPPETARQTADPEMIKRDSAITALDDPDSHTDKEVFSALLRFEAGRTEKSAVLSQNPERGRHLFSEAWRASRNCSFQGRSLFTLCFSKKRVRSWYPLFNVVCDEQPQHENRTFVLDDCRTFYCKDGKWYVESYEQLYFDRSMIRAFLHETDARLRRYLKTGHYLKEKPADEWLIPSIDSVIEADKAALIEASRPHITIDLSGLDHIREDADVTRDRLLTEEEVDDLQSEQRIGIEPVVQQTEIVSVEQQTEIVSAEQKAETLPAERQVDSDDQKPGAEPDQPVESLLDEDGLQIVRILLAGRDPSDMLKARHLMPSVEADRISESLFDEIGDNVVICEDGRLSLVEDYTEDIERLFGGTVNG